ncbi:alpha/beta hydrolase [Catenovulum sediminis]|uniref:Alpha/beta hydrolase n=1 Tax=Catenovulum sediminis TaxID=1740262 RepID=A0ABV1RE65_9ALTE
MFRILKVLSLLLYAISISALAADSGAKNGQQELEILHSGEQIIAGSLWLPEVKSTPSLVIMLTGSGPQDRDETLDGFKVFKTLAHHFAAAGIPSFRFDDPGVGGSSGVFSKATLQDHTRDVLAIIQFFKHSKEYGFNKFVLLGHSQGGIVAAHVAVGNADVSKVVLMGAPSVPLVDLVLYQLRLEYANAAVPKNQIEEVVSAHNQLMWAVNNNGNLQRAESRFKNATIDILSYHASQDQNQHEKANRAVSQQAENQYDEMRYVYSMPSLASFLYHDTALDYAKLSVPVLSLMGGKDLQVTIEQNKDAMEIAFLKSAAQFDLRVFNNANHYFQTAQTGLRDEYQHLDKNFTDGFVTTLTTWLIQ